MSKQAKEPRPKTVKVRAKEFPKEKTLPFWHIDTSKGKDNDGD